LPKRISFGRIGLLFCLPALATAAPPVHEFTLDNGLKLIVQEDHRAPVAVSQVWYKVGSSYEHEGQTGVAHALEHMMFKGTRKHGPNEFSQIISENGGEENAFTGYDYTAYFQKLAKSRLPVSFELEADRMRNLTLPKEEFAKEIKVVIEERRLRTEDNPESLLNEIAMATAYQTSPYRNPVIGWMADLERMTVEDLRAWYQRWYAPNNATVVVVGDVEPEAVHQLALKHFGPLRAESASPVQSPPEVPQRGTKRVTVRVPAQIPYLLMAYKTPVLKTAVENPKIVPQWEPFALEVLAGILSGGESARLNQRLVRDKQVAASAGVGYNLVARLDSVFSLEGTPAQGQTVETLEKALRAEVKALQEKPIDPRELQRVKAQVIASHTYERDSMFYQAMQIGLLETIGLSWRLKDDYVKGVKAVTADQVRAVAKKYLIDDGLTVAVLEPLSSRSQAKGQN
jgi:zinc protease